MDGPGELRPILCAQFGRRLPPLGDPRLSNGVGTAVVVFDGDDRPYLPRRAPRQSVFPGGYHCTASGEAVWREGPLEFDRIFTENICRELEEEVGLTRADLDWIRPVAFCREFLRAGKPQFFFAARTSLDASQLQSRRRAAIAAQLAHGRQEVLDDVLREFDPKLCTLECIANLTLAKNPVTGATCKIE
jgi:8-oxo-dGTP pyrophosphatase MutT (NUDIX family)